MRERIVQVYYGHGKGKTTAAVGQCICAASLGKDVIMIQFLKGRAGEEISILKRLEPEIKLFRFEKMEEHYQNLNDIEKQEEKKNILNGFNFARKVIETRESDVVVLDEILGLVDQNIIAVSDVIKLIESLKEGKMILTGENLPEELVPYVDILSKIEPQKE